MRSSAYSIGILMALLCIAGFLVPLTSVSASRTKSVTFSQYQEELVPGNSMSLHGVDVVFNCPGESNSPGFGPLFGFSGSKNAGPTDTGEFTLLGAPGAAAGDEGSATKVKVTPSKFKIEGTFDDSNGFGHDHICAEPLPATFILEGPCGSGVDVSFKVSNGINASFKGDVTCST